MSVIHAIVLCHRHGAHTKGSVLGTFHLLSVNLSLKIRVEYTQQMPACMCVHVVRVCVEFSGSEQCWDNFRKVGMRENGCM